MLRLPKAECGSGLALVDSNPPSPPTKMASQTGSSLEDRPIFGGSDSEDVTLSFHNVKRIAIPEGHQDNDKWLGHFVESCLISDAMVWFYD